MLVLHLNTFDRSGGAARAAYWLHSGLKKEGIDSRLLVQHKTTGESTITSLPGRTELFLRDIRWIFDGLPLLFYPQRQAIHWATGWFPNRLRKHIASISPDIINLHWVCRGFAPIGEIGKLCSLFNRPIVWTLHDSWPFTGGCHVPGTCTRYQDSCGQCPELSSQRRYDLSWLTLARKQRSWGKNKIVVVSPSTWLADCARKSSLFSGLEVHIIPNGIDTAGFAPIERIQARRILGLPENGKKKILCGGINAHNDPNKGFSLFLQSLSKLAADGQRDDIELIVYGESEEVSNTHPPFKAHYLGVLHDDAALRLAYSAADLFVLPSLQENLPNSIIEALACQTPVVAFAAGGIPDLIEDGINGFLAKPYDIRSLADCISLALSIDLKPSMYKQFTQKHMVDRYLNLYRHLVDRHA